MQKHWLHNSGQCALPLVTYVPQMLARYTSTAENKAVSSVKMTVSSAEPTLYPG